MSMQKFSLYFIRHGILLLCAKTLDPKQGNDMCPSMLGQRPSTSNTHDHQRELDQYDYKHYSEISRLLHVA